MVLTLQDDPAFARQALRAGASGYVLTEAADEELLMAIRLAAAGGTYLNPDLAARLAAGAFPVIRRSKGASMPVPIIAAYNPFLKDHAPVDLALAAAELTGANVIVASVPRTPYDGGWADLHAVDDGTQIELGSLTPFARRVRKSRRGSSSECLGATRIARTRPRRERRA